MFGSVCSSWAVSLIVCTIAKRSKSYCRSVAQFSRLTRDAMCDESMGTQQDVRRWRGKAVDARPPLSHSHLGHPDRSRAKRAGDRVHVTATNSDLTRHTTLSPSHHNPLTHHIQTPSSIFELSALPLINPTKRHDGRPRPVEALRPLQRAQDAGRGTGIQCRQK